MSWMIERNRCCRLTREIFFSSLFVCCFVVVVVVVVVVIVVVLVAIHERRESVQKFWKRTTKRPIREDGTHDALFASKSPRETKTKASLAWKARICDASSPFPTVAFGVARARARARLRKSKKTTKADLVVARQKRHFKPHFSKAHLFHILVAVVTLHVRLFFALRVRVVIVVRERDVVVRTGLVSSFFSSSSSFRTHSSYFFFVP